MKQVICLLVVAMLLSGCSAKFVIVFNSGCMDADSTLTRTGTDETFSPKGTIPVMPK